jgi:transposase
MSIVKVYNDLKNYNIKGNNKKNFIRRNFNIHINTLYNWLKNVPIPKNIENVKISNVIESIVLYYNKIGYKTIKIKKKIFENHKVLLSYKDIMYIYKKNNINKNNYKITTDIENFIIKYINFFNTKTAKEIIEKIYIKYGVKISKSSIYIIMKKNNLSYKRTKIITNPYSKNEQIEQIKKVKNTLNNVNINNVISIDETSIELNTKPYYGWSSKGKECLIINNGSKIINKRYSLLVATSNKKIIDFSIIEKTFKKEKFINFMKKLNKKDIKNEKTYLMDNAIIHKTKDFYNYLKEKNMHILYNAPYHSELNPIEYVFSLLKKIISKNISKTKEDIIKSILILKNTITPKTLNNIFNHSLNEMDNFIH